MFIPLDEKDWERGKQVALGRERVHKEHGTPEGKVLSDGFNINLVGAMGEIAVSKAFNLDWTGELIPYEQWVKIRRTKADGDVENIGVRTRRTDWGDLILHPYDEDTRPFVLVYMKLEGAEIVGWVFGWEGKRKGVWKDVGYGRPCYYVPVAELSKDWGGLLVANREYGKSSYR